MNLLKNKMLPPPLKNRKTTRSVVPPTPGNNFESRQSDVLIGHGGSEHRFYEIEPFF